MAVRVMSQDKSYTGDQRKNISSIAKCCGNQYYLVLLLVIAAIITAVGVVFHVHMVTKLFSKPIIRSMNELGFAKSTSQFIPIYYMNLNRSPDRRKYMEANYRNGFPSDQIVMQQRKTFKRLRRLIRVEAVDGQSMLELEQMLFLGDDDSKKTVQDVVRQYSATNGNTDFV